MTDALTNPETLFAAFPAAMRLAILDALQTTIMLRTSVAVVDEAADVLVRLGYPETADSARKARVVLP